MEIGLYEALIYVLAEIQFWSHGSPNGIYGEEVDTRTGFGFNIIGGFRRLIDDDWNVLDVTQYLWVIC